MHRAFQEHLCATHLASLSLDNQLQQLEAHCVDPQWREIILGVAYLTSRSKDVRDIVNRLKAASADSPARFGIDTILCEIAVGPFQCPPDVCLELCNRFIQEVESGSWMP